MIFKKMFTASELFCDQNKEKFSISSNDERKVISRDGAVAFTETNFKEFSFFYGSTESHKNKAVHFSNKEDLVVMAFQFCGDVTIQSINENEGVSLKCNQHIISFYPKDKLTLNAVGCPALKMFEVAFQPDFFKKYLPDNAIFNTFLEHINTRQSASITSENGTITVQMQQIVNDIIHTKREGNLKKLFIESKILELLLLQIEYFDNNSEMLLQTVHQSHTEKIIKAKKIIEENTYTPCSLIDLAHMIGTNECTLKKGFKELTGNTVFGYWNDLKMKNAYEMIATSDIPIYEVAYQLGYKYPHHFTAAFKKKFNLTPAELRAGATERATI